MRRLNPLIAGLLMFTSAMVSAGEGGAADVDITLLQRSTMCGADAKEVEWIDSSARLQALVKSLFTPHRKIPEVDFEHEVVLLVGRGYQPTAGYELTLSDNRGTVSGDTLEIRVDWMTPPPDMMVAQVITNPCLLLAIPRGGYQRIRVVDQKGDELALITVGQ